MKVTLLGTGSAYRTPTVGGFWGKCDPHNEKNNRLCQSIFIESKETKLLVDAGPDFRQQSIFYGVNYLDAVFVTHAHYDHFFGLPELEVFSFIQKSIIPVYAASSTWSEITPSIEWLIHTDLPGRSGSISRVDITHNQELNIGDIKLIPFNQHHGNIDSTGFRINDFAYTTDVNKFPKESWEFLAGVKTWVLECDSIEKTDNHNNLEQALEWIAEIKPEKTYLTHIHPYVDHDYLSSLLPENVYVAYDGLQISI